MDAVPLDWISFWVIGELGCLGLCSISGRSFGVDFFSFFSLMISVQYVCLSIWVMEKLFKDGVFLISY